VTKAKKSLNSGLIILLYDPVTAIAAINNLTLVTRIDDF